MKKAIALLLAAIMMLGLVACGNTDAPADEPTNDTPAAEDTNTDDAPAEEPVEDLPAEDAPAAPPADGETLGQQLKAEFHAQMTADPAIETQALADALLAHESILFSGATMEVEPGYLTGFDVEITGFDSAMMFAPMIGTIPFMGYLFRLADGADVDAFTTMLSENANPNWNICTMADETVISAEGNTVFFLMCPYAIEE